MTDLTFIVVIFFVYLLWFLYFDTGNGQPVNEKRNSTRNTSQYRSHNYVHIVAESPK